MGRIKVTRSDARALVDLFLARWRYSEGGDALSSMTRDGYVGFPTADQRKLREHVLNNLTKSAEGKAGIKLPDQMDERDSVEETERRWVDVEKVVYECQALITLSRHKIAVGQSPAQTISAVWHMFNHLYEYDRLHDFPERLLIWVIDLGGREVEQPDAFEEYLNAGILALQLASFNNFDTSKDDDALRRPASVPKLTITESIRRDDLWRWLVERTVIVAQNLRLEEINELYGDEEEHLGSIRLKDIGVTPEHVLPSTTPRAWGRELLHLYGKEIAASDATFTVSMREEPWILNGQPRTLRYFAHTQLPKARRQKLPSGMQAEWVTKSEELRSPGEKHDLAFRLVYLAARHRLGMNTSDAPDIGWEALAYLRKIRFSVLDLRSFLRSFLGIH